MLDRLFAPGKLTYEMISEDALKIEGPHRYLEYRIYKRKENEKTRNAWSELSGMAERVIA